ncbi:MAG: tyrosine-type recombinase/integrase [Candidatus Omnitrophica bacterium]|nr:tyrosine-type recombinase/integrase [Candidatus Omnitrophota bacterium]
MGRVFQIGKTWYIDVSYKGKRIREAVGKDKKLAITILKKKEIELIENRHLDIKRNAKVKFSDFSTYFLNTYSKVNKKSWKRDQLSINHLNKFFGSKFLYEITSKDIEEYKKKRLETGIKTSTLNRELACLKTILNKAVEWEYLKETPPKIKLFKENNQRVRYLTENEAKTLIDLSPEPLKGIIIIALNTGMRQGEILNLKWKDIDFKEKIITIWDTKSKEKRYIPINEIVYNTLLNIDRNPESEYVFYGEDPKKPISGSYITHSFNRIVKKAGIKDFRFHDLRHTFASWLVMKGVNLKTIQELLGHKDQRMTLRYSHLSPEVKKEAVEILSENFNFGKNTAKVNFNKNKKIVKTIDRQRIGGVA